MQAFSDDPTSYQDGSESGGAFGFVRVQQALRTSALRKRGLKEITRTKLHCFTVDIDHLGQGSTQQRVTPQSRV